MPDFVAPVVPAVAVTAIEAHAASPWDPVAISASPCATLRVECHLLGRWQIDDKTDSAR